MEKYQRLAPDMVSLLPGVFQERFNLNRDYLISLRNDNLLQNYYSEAGMGPLSGGRLRNTMHGDPGSGDDLHWGWESPACQARGHFLGHWLSAAARVQASTGDGELKVKLDHIISELSRCQEKNGGEWIGSIPEKYFRWTAEGNPTWAPQYVAHKMLMGLYDAYALADSAKA